MGMGRWGRIVAAAVVLLLLGAGAYVVALQLATSPAVDLGPAIKIEDGIAPATPTPSPTPKTTPSSSPKPTEPAKSSTRPTPKKSDVLPSKSTPVKPLPPSDADDDDNDWDDDWDDDDD